MSATVAPDRTPAPGALGTLLEVAEVDVHYGLVRALQGVTLEVGEGEMVALVGANGAGKSTTLRAISGLVHPTAGSIRFGGLPIERLPAQRIVALGVAHVPEGRELFPSLTVLENLQLGHWVRGEAADFRRRRDLVMEYFPRLRERARQAAGTLSGGEQQMLVIARGLMSAPRLLIVDELSLGLAPMIVEQLFQILHEVNRDGTAVLLVEQFVHMALQHTHRAYVLAKGQVVISGPSQEMLNRPELLEAYLGNR